MTDPTPRDRALAGEVVKVTDERLAEMQRIAIASEGVEVDSLHWHWVAAINELIEARKEVELLTHERDDWAQKWHRVRAELAELKYPGMKGVIKTTGSPGETPEAHPQSSEKAGARSSEGPGSILGCTCILCEYHRSAEDIERKLRAEAGEGTCGE